MKEHFSMDSCRGNDYIYLDETEEEKLAFKIYVERENFLHYSGGILFRIKEKIKGMIRRKNER